MLQNNIPEQEKGGSSDTYSEKQFANEQEAIAHFEKVKERFLDINRWEQYAGSDKAEFSLMDENGQPVFSPGQVGDYIRIQIPGPENATGDGFDWVKIEVHDKQATPNGECLYIRVRPAADPTVPAEETAHFFKDEATSNFLIERKGNVVSAEIHGRNEIPNTEDLSLGEKIRNVAVAIGGMLGGSKFQWKALTKGWIAEAENGS